MFGTKIESGSAWKIGALLLGAVLLIPVGWLVAFSFYWQAKSVPSAILDFHPTEFRAQAASPFFYSIGDQLKYFDEIDPNAPTLLQGKFGEYLVSPDQTKIAIVRNGELVVVDGQGSFLRVVTPVDSIYRDSIYKKPKPIGQQFFRDANFQWTKDSHSLYLIRDEFYESQGSQLYSAKGELWKYDLDSGKLQLVVKPFPAYDYFFGLKGVYFSVPTPRGDLRLRYFDGTTTRDVGDVNASAIPVENLASGFAEEPFFSFSTTNFQNIALAGKGLGLKTDEKSGIQQLEINGRPYLNLSQGKNFKGNYHCSEINGSRLLPGDRYLVFNFSYCKNYNGQLLIDTQSGSYKRLPRNTSVYGTLNTVTHPVYRVTCCGMMDW